MPSYADSLLETLLTAKADKGVSPWVCCWARRDHIYPTCPHARRSEGGMVIVNDPRNRLDPDDDPHEDICGWCKRLWRARGCPSIPFEAVG